jgi:signal transduction histidine kinase
MWSSSNSQERKVQPEFVQLAVKATTTSRQKEQDASGNVSFWDLEKPFEVILDDLTSTVVRFTGAVAAKIDVMLEENRAPTFVSRATGLADKYLAILKNIETSQVASIEKSGQSTSIRMATHAFAAGKPLFYRKARQHFLENPLYASLHTFLCSMSWDDILCIPLSYQTHKIGILSLYYCSGQIPIALTRDTLTSMIDKVAEKLMVARSLHKSREKAVQEERLRLAMDLHDTVAQSLHSITLFAEAGRRLIEAADQERAQEYLSCIGETARHMLKEMRPLLYGLHPSILAQNGLLGAIKQRLKTVEKLIGMVAHLQVDVTIGLPYTLETELYHLIQEALNNTIKHSQATSVTVCICATLEKIEVEVIDNGKGFSLNTVERQGGLGLVGMQERTARLGGTFTISSTEGQGTWVKICLDTHRYSSDLPGEEIYAKSI